MHISRPGLILMIGLFVLGACGAPAPAKQGAKMDQIEMPSYVMKAAASIQEAYRYAVTHSDELKKYPCYCGCSRMGHKSNLDCYIKDTPSKDKITFDPHASACGVCVDITHDVIRMMQVGKAAPEIRAYIDAQYSQYGPSTNTPLPTS
jgi:hypothetical protein